MDRVTEEWRSARERFPSVELPLEAYRSYIAARLSTATSEDQAAEEELTFAFSDIYLACACTADDPDVARRAAALLATTYRRDIDGVRSRFGARAPSKDQVLSVVLERLLVPKGGKAPKIAEYAGRGELRGFVRVVTARTILNDLALARRPEEPFEEAVMSAMLVSADNPELVAMKREGRSAVKEAFAAACAELERSERRMIRHAFVEDLNVDEIGALYSVHRATAARWVKKASEKLGATFKKRLRGKLTISPAEVQSFLRAVGDSMEMSVAKWLGESAGKDGGIVEDKKPGGG